MADVAGSSRLEENLDLPFAPFGYSVSYLHCMSVSLAQGGEGLGTMWGQQTALELLAEAGFTTSEIKQVEGDWFNNYYIARKDGSPSARARQPRRPGCGRTWRGSG